MKKTVLIVEDDKTTAKLYKEVMELDEHVVLTSSDGPDAIHQYVEHHPDLVLMDIDIPLLDGCKAIKQIKEIDSKANIIIISGNIQPEDDCISVVEKYNIQFLYKPIDLNTLLKLTKNI